MARPSADAYDWLGETEQEYDVGNFYTRATNTHDHSANLQVPLPKDILGHMQEVVNRNKFPYSSVQAIIRDAICHRLEWLKEKEGDFDGGKILAMDRMRVKQEMRRYHQQVQREIFEEFVSNVRGAMDARNYNEVLINCDETEMGAMDMDDSWREQLVVEIGRAREAARERKERGY